jgi:hypothetical protein
MTRFWIAAVAETPACIWFIEQGADVADALNAAGSVYADVHKGAAGTVPKQVLNTNDLLCALWTSPAGGAWVGSASGHVATTARVSWPAAVGVDYEGKDPLVPWTVTALPAVRSTGLRPNIQALWGLNDHDVIAGCVDGHLYAWDGTSWTQTHDGPGTIGSIRAVAGTAEAVYVVGDRGVLRRTATGWQPVAVPADVTGTFTGVHVVGNTATVSVNERSGGRVLRGTDPLTELCTTPLPLLALVPVNERVLFAVGDGVAELLDTAVEVIKSNFKTQSAWRGVDGCFFVPPTQDPPMYIRHTPSGAKKWWGVTH